MLAKLALRNVRRQIGNYLIYFITVVFTVSLIFAVNNIIYNEQLQTYAESIQDLKAGLVAITVIIALIVAFVLGYATSFMLHLRKREFGTYLTLGMTRKNILSIFILETMIMCFAALGLGLILGLFMYQGMLGIIANLLEMEFSFAAYSPQGLLLTIILVASIFILSSFTSTIYLKKVSIYSLINKDEKIKKYVRHPFLWMSVALISFAAIILSCFIFGNSIKSIIDATSTGGMMFASLALLSFSLIMFHIAISRSLINILLKNKKFCSRGTNTFTLRGISRKLNSNSIMAGILAFLLSFAVIGSNVSFAQKAFENISLEKNFPFDISASLDIDTGQTPPVSIEQAEKIIEKYSAIQQIIRYNIYTSNDNYLHGFTRWSGEGYEGLYDSFITESDFNKLQVALNREPVNLNGEFIIISDTPSVWNNDFSSSQLNINGQLYDYGGMSNEFPFSIYTYMVAVVPDKAADNMQIQAQCAAIDLQSDTFDARSLRDELSYIYEYESGYSYNRCDYRIKEYSRLERNGTSAIFVVGALYIAVVFVFMVMAILALKTLSSISEDKRRYEILYSLGANEHEQNKTLFRQTFSFFFIPFVIPMLLSFPTSYFCNQIMTLNGFGSHNFYVYKIAGLIVLVLTLVYLLYFTATYLIAKRNIIKRGI